MTTVPQVLGLTGKAGSGKTTAANWILLNHKRSVRLAFARPIKRMIYEMLREAIPRGWPIEPKDYMDDPVLKEQPVPFLSNQSPRRLMQTLGTEWGRKAVHPDFWVNIAAAKLERVLGQTLLAAPNDRVRVVIDDCRFANEAEMIRRYNGVVVRIVRPGESKPNNIDGHDSERMDFDVDAVIVNDGTIEDFQAKLAAMFPPPSQ